MTTEPDVISEGGTGSPTTGVGGLTVPLGVHRAALTERDLAHAKVLRQADFRFYEERDRRYAEVAVEREKASAIKEKADERALLLQSETQKYKDEKANDLRTQIERERGSYATKDDLLALSDKIGETIKPLADFVTAQLAAATIDHRKEDTSTNWKIALTGIVVTVLLTLVVLASNGKLG